MLEAVIKLQNSLDLKKLEFKKWWIVLILAMVFMGIGLLLVCNPFKETTILIYVIGGSLLGDGLVDLWTMFLLTRLLKKLRKKEKESQNPVAEKQEVAYWVDETEKK